MVAGTTKVNDPFRYQYLKETWDKALLIYSLMKRNLPALNLMKAEKVFILFSECY